MLNVITEISVTENFSSINLVFSFLQEKDKEVKCELWGKSRVVGNKALPLR